MPTGLASPGSDNVKLVLEETLAHKKKKTFQTPPAICDATPLPPACPRCWPRSGALPPSPTAPQGERVLGMPHPIPSLPCCSCCPAGARTPTHPCAPSCPLAPPSLAASEIPIAAGSKDVQGIMGLGGSSRRGSGNPPGAGGHFLPLPSHTLPRLKRFKMCFISPGQRAEEFFLFQQCQTLQIRKETGNPFPDSPSAAAGYSPPASPQPPAGQGAAVPPHGNADAADEIVGEQQPCSGRE